jgi:hypothetical protein
MLLISEFFMTWLPTSSFDSLNRRVVHLADGVVSATVDRIEPQCRAGHSSLRVNGKSGHSLFAIRRS